MVLSTHTWQTLEGKEQEAQAHSDGLTSGPKHQGFGCPPCSVNLRRARLLMAFQECYAGLCFILQN